ncbi:MAG: DUF5979 domain-containing protein [Leucobacter sp.]
MDLRAGKHYRRGERRITRRSRLGSWLAGGLAVLLFGTALMAGGAGAAPAAAMEGASLRVVKTVDGQDAKRDLRPGDSVVYRVEFRVNDEDADAPVRVIDRLPEQFAGWQISGLTATVGGTTTGVTLDLPGIASGQASSAPVAGTLGSTSEELAITVGVAQPVQAGTGNDSGLGMSTLHTGWIDYTITIPSGLSPLDPVLRTDLTNTVTFTAKAGAVDLSASDSAIISVDNPIAVDVTPSKTWTPAGQNFQPGAASAILIGATQASNVAASALRLQDPADPAQAIDGATSLHADNPFNYVDFAGFTGDPTTNLPAGADSAAVEVYRLSGGSWNWAPWDASIPNSEIAGVRLAYIGSIPPGASVAQGFAVGQRSTHRTEGTSISNGYQTSNEVRATVEVPNQPAVSKDAAAPFTVAREQIDVSAQKRFIATPGSAEMMSLSGVTAGDTVGVVLRAINGAVPQSTVLDRLVIAEPGAGSDARYFGEDLAFAGFDSGDTAAIWPSGATSAEITWQHPGGPTTATVAAGDPLPSAPAGVTGFELAFLGAIAPGAAAEVRYQLATNPDEGFVGAGGPAGPFRNTIDVTGQKTGLDDDTANAGANLSLVAPRIDVSIEKRVGPGTVLPGQGVVVQLDTEVQTSGGRTVPTEIVVEDVLSGPGTFWDAFDASEILPPISRPVNGGDPAVQADLRIEVRDSGGAWTTLATNPDESTPIPVPAGATGLRFVYTNAAGLSQISYVKPNIAFTARTALRSDATPTAGVFGEPKLYENVASASSTGVLDSRTVTGSDEDRQSVGIRGTEGGTGPGPGGLWADKDWAHNSLVSQSGTSSWTVQEWAVTQSGYRSVELQDPAAPTASGAGTVFEAFDLTHIRPIVFQGAAGSGRFDPMLRWDLVTDVQLWDGAAWNSVTAPVGGWMNADGFVGHTLTEPQRQSALGVRLVLAENTAARQDAATAGDLTAPAVGSGVAASAEIRSFRLDWQLRDLARTADGSQKWVKENDTPLNCEGGSDGCIDNVFRITGVASDDSRITATANDSIQLLDDIANVTLSKQVRPLPISSAAPLADRIDMVAPNPGELAQADYPQARYTLTTSNSSTMPAGARGVMKLGKIRVTDTSTHQLDPAPDFDMDHSPFAGRDFATEVAGPSGNHFDEFTLTGVSFEALPAYIDTDWSTVELWLYDGTDPAGTTREFTLDQACSGDAEFLASLPQTIGVAVTYSGTDPEVNGNRIVAGDTLTVHLNVQLRQTERLSGEAVAGGTEGAVVPVTNEALSRGWDAVVNPEDMPTDQADAAVDLTSAQISVNLEKQITVDHGSSSDQTIVETDPDAPVSVLLTADPDGSTAPLNTLRIEDDTASFWDRFQFTGFGTPTHPTNADSAAFEVYADEAWTAYSEDIDPAEIRGVAVTFSRTTGEAPFLFPEGSVSWNNSWGTATLPFTVQLRDGAAVDWENGDQEENTATATADNVQYGQAVNGADAGVDFSPGTHSIQVVKRAPNDTTTHLVDALASLPWQLVFTNTGDSYLPITRVTDAMPETIGWDGEQPTFASTPGAAGVSGLSEDPADIAVTLSDDGRNLVFEWPEGSRMEPGETMTIGLGLMLQPLPTGQRATNSVVVETGVPLETCRQPSDFGQEPQAPNAANECSNTNYVQPRAGTVIAPVKTVNGEHLDTLGEDLVGGALNVRTGEECAPGNYLPIGSDYTRSPCASYTAVGATDLWKLQQINSGTNPLSRMTIVDMMPYQGDKMLDGGAERGSTFRPVFVGETAADIFTLSGLPAGATTVIDVTTDPHACVGPNPGSSLWAADPECVDTASNPANATWVGLESYTGGIEEIAGFRIRIDMSAQPLQPAGNVVVEFETVNRVVDQAADGLQPTLAQFQTPQFAWNQNGVIAWDTADNRVNLPAAPQRAGVTVKTGELVVAKEVLGAGADNAPDSFPVELSCTVPSGVAEPERVELDLGEYALLTVPKDGSATVPGVPIGADCTAREAGAVGAHGETGRSIETSPGVNPASDGLSAEIKIRERDGEDTLLSLRNTYTLGELVIEKAVVSSTEYASSAEELGASFDFELVCRANGMESEIRRGFQLQAGEQHREADLPEGAECVLTETATRGAQSTAITVAGEESSGESRDGIAVTAAGGHVLVSNVFLGVPPEELQRTGAPGAWWTAAIAVLLLGLGAAGMAISRRRRIDAD